VIVVFSLSKGAFEISPLQSLAILLSDTGWIAEAYTNQQANVLLQIRLPRIILATLVGGGLGIAGAAMQGLFRNPLVEPGLIGVSSGSALV
ncbi:MAG TPA: iron ABC transporter permease, partial [Algoriphagus sp.]|nr:iron ABC transporter permease [Algoriphagus sp.]